MAVFTMAIMVLAVLSGVYPTQEGNHADVMAAAFGISLRCGIHLFYLMVMLVVVSRAYTT